MKKLIVLFFLVMSLNLIFAELEVDIPFEMDIIGEDYSVVGPFDYESEWMTITNVGSTTESYTLTWTYESLPTDWTVSICNPSYCLTANWPVPLELAPGAFEEIHISIHAVSTGGFPISITLDEGDLIEPMVLPFTFRTEDYIASANEIIIEPVLTQNYPNPFNPTTTISYELTVQELSEAKITIFNIKGQTVQIFDNLNNNSITWNGLDYNGKKVDSGIYFYQLTTGEKSETRKMVLLK
jgi:Secretion system C-terminal sorting domain